jgi:hypothetical protein
MLPTEALGACCNVKYVSSKHTNQGREMSLEGESAFHSVLLQHIINQGPQVFSPLATIIRM